VRVGSDNAELSYAAAMFSELLPIQRCLQTNVRARQAPYRAERSVCQTGQRLNKREDFNKYYEPCAVLFGSLYACFQFFSIA